MRLAFPRAIKRLQGLKSGLGRNIWVQVATSFLGGFYRGGFNAVWQPFVLSLGGSITLLGRLESLGGWGGLVSSLFQLLGGWLADRLGRRPLMILGSVLTMAAFGLYTLAAVLHLWLLLIPGVVFLGMGLIGRAAGSSVTAESAREERRGMAFSLTMVAYTVPNAVASVVGGQASERWGYVPVMLTSFICEGLVLLTLVRFLRESLAKKPGQAGEGNQASLGRSSVIVRRLWRMLVPLAFDSFCWGTALSLLFGLFKESYNFTDGQLGWINASFSLIWAISQIPVGWLVDRHGCKFFLVISEVLSAVCLVILILWPTFPGAMISYGLLGFTAALWVPALYKLLAAMVGEEERGQAMGLVFTVQGLARFPAPMLASALYEWGGFNGPLFAGLVACSTVIVLLMILVKDPPTPVPDLQ